ncbi:hypothetical protein AVEN_71140-1 [Araneus ventricosus]|uniref:DUF4817 domain-containing protein n=1 Tax=Araneus ventricosus TaxID=182803 RepID=A0A4Y2KVV0_ARAVE|nr:hypothetical protein AVEN_71140-1 [Araneus ventricosus]
MVAWKRAVAWSKLSCNKILELVWFLAVNEALIKLKSDVFIRIQPFSGRNGYGHGGPRTRNSIYRWLTQFQETGSVLHRKGAGRPSTSQEMLIASKKRLLAVHENQRDEIVKNIVYKTPESSLDELKRRIVTAIQNVTPQMLDNTWREIEFRLDVLRATKGSHVQIH